MNIQSLQSHLGPRLELLSSTELMLDGETLTLAERDGQTVLTAGTPRGERVIRGAGTVLRFDSALFCCRRLLEALEDGEEIQKDEALASLSASGAEEFYPFSEPLKNAHTALTAHFSGTKEITVRERICLSACVRGEANRLFRYEPDYGAYEKTVNGETEELILPANAPAEYEVMETEGRACPLVLRLTSLPNDRRLSVYAVKDGFLALPEIYLHEWFTDPYGKNYETAASGWFPQGSARLVFPSVEEAKQTPFLSR